MNHLANVTLLPVLAALPLAACSEVSATPAAPSTQAPGPSAAAPAPTSTPGQDPAVDQATLEAWTKEIKAQVAELRKREFPRDVDVAVSDEATLKKYIADRQEKAETPEDRANSELVAKLMGVLPAKLDLQGHMMEILEGQVGGFYDPETEGFYLMESFGGGLARHILAHELTHALDDQLYDLDGTFEALEGNADALWAFQALVEGSGTQIGGEWTTKYGKLSMEEQMEAATMGMDVLADAQPYVYKPLLGAYLRGQMFLCRVKSLMELAMKAPTPAPDDYERLFRNPPLSSEQVLHPEKYWVEAKRDDPIPVAIDAGSLPEGWSVAREDTLGELGLALFVEPPADRKGIDGPMAVMGVKYTFDAAAGWGGDRYVLLRNGEAYLLFVATTWDRAEDAKEMKAELAKLAPHLETSLAELASVRGVSGSGFAHEDAGWPHGIVLRAWIGTDAAGAASVAKALRVEVGGER